MPRRDIPFLLLLGLTIGSASLAEQAPTPRLRIYLPRNRTVEGQVLLLGDVAMLVGDGPLAQRAGQVKLGRTPFPGETLTLDRRTLLARLAAEGIHPEHVELTGSKDVALQRDGKVLEGKDIVHRAELYLRQHPPSDVQQWEVIRHPQPIEMPGSTPPVVRCEPDPSPPAGHAGVIVHVTDGGNFHKTRRVLFKLLYRCVRAVATRTIAQGQPLTRDNITLESVLRQRPPEPDWTPPFGAVAVRTLQKGAEITETLVRRPAPPLLVKRNQMVRITIQGPTWKITALGKALDEGRAGELVRVRNVDSNKVITARVNRQGDVVPLARK
jgi:flagellar basal body P-ring formation protein FlgA